MTLLSIVRIFLTIVMNICFGLRNIKSFRSSSVNQIISSSSSGHDHVSNQRTRRVSLEASEKDSIPLSDYEFLDCGDLKRLERFGDVFVVRSCPSALWPKKISSTEWNKPSNVVYDGSSGKNGKWTGLNNLKANWSVEFNNTNMILPKLQKSETTDSTESEVSITNGSDQVINSSQEEKKNKIVFTLSCSDQGQVGVFPEQQENWKWIGDSLRKSLLAEKEANKKDIVINPDDVISENYKESFRPPPINSKKAVSKTRPLKNDNNKKSKDMETSKEIVPVRKVLNGFAYTGGSSLAALSVHDFSLENGFTDNNAVQVVHLDAAKSSVQWAMRNAAASGLIITEDNNSIDVESDNTTSSGDDDSISARNIEEKERDESTGNAFAGGEGTVNLSPSSSTSSSSFPSARWITDDCLSFLEREVRRGNKYDGLIFDPPAFGRASNGKIWKLEKDLPILVEGLIPQLLSPDPLFVLLSCHDVAWPPERLAEILSVAMSSVMKNAMISNIKASKKNKTVQPIVDKNSKKEKEKSKQVGQNRNKNVPENSNSDIQSVFLAGGILEYGPMILKPNKFSNNIRKLEIGNPLPLGGFARWSKII